VGDATGIEWTDATWNPVVGCSVLSPGCTHCYAMQVAAARLDGNAKTPHYLGTTQRVNGAAVWSGKVAAAPDHIWEQPLRWKTPRRVFVNSMGDLFHAMVSLDQIDRAFAIMVSAPQHTFQILTKRPDVMKAYMAKNRTAALIDAGAHRAFSWPPKNVWLGVSCEDQRRADERVPVLLDTPAAVRFVSAEPLLGPVDFVVPYAGANVDALRGAAPGIPKLDWVIVGGESGRDARPMHPDWVRRIRDNCAAAGVPFFFKQWGEWSPYLRPPRAAKHWFDDGPGACRVGKKVAGRLLDCVTHDAFPEVA
jgi:protein gp37